MSNIEKNELLEFEILKHVEESPRLNNRMAAAKLGCSVKLAHALLGKMVDKGLLHVKKLHSRRWDYFLTPKGLTEKARLTYEFLDFSMQFYHDARKLSSQVCRDIAESGKKTVAFLGAGDLAEIVYLGVKEWDLELTEVYNGDTSNSFLGLPVRPHSELPGSQADAIIVCLYDKSHPMGDRYLPESISPSPNMHWVFSPEVIPAPASPAKVVATREDSTRQLTPAERIERFCDLQTNALTMMSPEGKARFHERNMSKRSISPNAN